MTISLNHGIKPRVASAGPWETSAILHINEGSRNIDAREGNAGKSSGRSTNQPNVFTASAAELSGVFQFAACHFVPASFGQPL